MASQRTLGQIAYEAFAADLVNDNFGSPYPNWDVISSDEKHGWEVAAQAACAANTGLTATA